MIGPTSRDLNDLDPIFRARVEELLVRMTRDGWDPLVWETYRSPLRAKALALLGRGTKKSMHCYRLAVDIISASRKWSAPAGFWLALARHSRDLGLVPGIMWRKRDKPHVQAVPVSDQAYIRTATPEQIAWRVRSRLRA